MRTDDAAGGDNGADARHAEMDAAASGELEIAASTTLVEVAPEVAVLFGETPEGMALIDLDCSRRSTGHKLSAALGSAGGIPPLPRSPCADSPA